MEIIIGGLVGALVVIAVIALGTLYMRDKIAPVSGLKQPEDEEEETKRRETDDSRSIDE